MNRLWLRADTEDAAFRRDELTVWKSYNEFVTAGLLRRGEDLTEVECDACGDAHIETVNWITEPPGTERPRSFDSHSFLVSA